LEAPFWWVVVIGSLFTMARFSEAFLVLRAEQSGIPIAYIPLVMVAMNAVYAGSAYPFGKLSDRKSHTGLLVSGMVVLIGADGLLASSANWLTILAGVSLWGIHLGMTQGLMARMVADQAPEDLRGTAFGMFNLVTGIAMLMASPLAGFLWDHYGAASTFQAGAVFALMALMFVALRERLFTA
jgi:MFS family permease